VTQWGRKAGGWEPLGRTLLDIAQILESAERSEERVCRTLVLLRQLVPYERCALLEAQPGREPRLIVVPEVPPERGAFLRETLTKLFGQIVEDPTPVPRAPPGPPGSFLTVPLIGLDKVIGVLFVHSVSGGYGVRHLRLLSMVGSKLAAYLTMLHARVEEALRTREIEKARGAAEMANRAKDAFLAMVSHELKTPLAVALEGARILGSKGRSEADRVRALELIEVNLRAQAKLIDDLVDLSHIAAAELRLDLQLIEPARWVKAAIEELRPEAERKSIRLEAALDESLKPHVVDPRRLGQIVSNLLANAIQFTPSGGHIEVCLERAGSYARIRVIDSGKGISAEFLPHVFDRFRQANCPSVHPHGGLGIGLAIVKSLVELHGGRVRAESAGEGKGATFTVELPLAPEALPRTDAVHNVRELSS
jgi:signal transduction histidine kinase